MAQRYAVELISLAFALLLAGLVVTYYFVGRVAPRYQWIVLLVGSMAFYCLAGSWQTLLLLLVVAVITWGAAQVLHKIEQQGKAARKEAKGRDAKKAVKKAYARKKRIVFWGSLALGVSLLVYFKYWNVLLFYVGAEPSTNSLGILLPLGISFYTFQAVGYLIDSYNAKYEPQKNFARYLLFVSYFPQVIQGPINRYDALASQFSEVHHANGTHIERGLLRLGYGIVKKIAIANLLSGTVSTVFTDAAGPQIPGSLAIYGVVLYSIQMYADFSGGIDIVEGASELFGISMAQNFRQPYFSVSLADFWRRWHMSLGTWMRDYVFYPLAVTAPSRRFGKWAGRHLGKHAGRTLPACVANILVFLFVGLWHGAEAHYLVWGLYNGVVVALADLCAPLFDKIVARLHIRRESVGFYLFSIVRTFAVVCVGRFFDCFAHVTDAFYALGNVLTGHGFISVQNTLASYGVQHANLLGFTLPTLVACVFVFAVDVMYERGIDVRSALLAQRVPVRVLFYFLVIFMALGAASYAPVGGGGFLYANF